MNPFARENVTVNVENTGAEHRTAAVKRILSAAVMPIRETSIFWTRATQSAFVRETATINIEDTNIRFLVTKGKWVERWESVPLAPGIVQEGLILNTKAVSAVISELIASRRLKRGKVIASLSGIQSVHRIVELPKMPRKLLGEAIMGEARKAMSIPLEKTYLSWYRLRAKKDELQRFFLLGVPQNIMDAEVQCLNQAGINPPSMNIKPLALAKMINRAEALVIDIEPESCTIVVIAGGVPIIMRSVVMSTGYSPLERAQHVLQEFERTLQFYKSICLDKAPNPETSLFLTGGLADDGELRQTIASEAGHNIEPLDCPLQYPPGFPLAQFAVNIGLALKGASPAARQVAPNGPSLIPNFDILPDVYRPRGFPARQILSVTGVLVGIALILPLYQIADGAAFAADQRQIEKNMLNQQVLLRHTQIKEAKQIEDSIASVKSRQQNLRDVLRDFQRLQDQRSRFYNTLYVAAVTVLPDGVSFQSITEEAGKLSLACQASSYETALGYADALRQTDRFSDVQVQSLRKASDDRGAVSFTVSLKWE
ncbi:MAG: PilN domain-containing protein [Dehalococcoidia bacterium]|nr:PilN domain-containing protein [Dehalococcoidia bacterium]